MTTRRWPWLALLAGAVACSPALDWRETRPDGGAGLTVLFPCRATSHARMVMLAGATVRLTLHACSAGGATWGVALADVADPARVAPALAALRASASGNVSAVTQRAIERTVAGATPNPEAGAAILGGHFPDGRPAQMHMAVFARATVVFQVSVVGERLDAAELDPFFTSLRFTS